MTPAKQMWLAGRNLDGFACCHRKADGLACDRNALVIDLRKVGAAFCSKHAAKGVKRITVELEGPPCSP